MKTAVENLLEAQKYAVAIRPKVGGFPTLAEVLRQAGVKQNFWYLPSCQSIYVTTRGVVVNQGIPLVSGIVEVPPFDREALIRALRRDQAGEGSFPEFLQASWEAGVVRYEVDFEKRQVVYFGTSGESYLESYPLVNIQCR